MLKLHCKTCNHTVVWPSSGPAPPQACPKCRNPFAAPESHATPLRLEPVPDDAADEFLQVELEPLDAPPLMTAVPLPGHEAFPAPPSADPAIPSLEIEPSPSPPPSPPANPPAGPMRVELVDEDDLVPLPPPLPPHPIEPTLPPALPSDQGRSAFPNVRPYEDEEFHTDVRRKPRRAKKAASRSRGGLANFSLGRGLFMMGISAVWFVGCLFTGSCWIVIPVVIMLWGITLTIQGIVEGR